MNCYLPFEQFVYTRLLRTRPANLIIWGLVELGLCSLPFLMGLGFRYSTFFREYFPAVLLGILAINADVFCLLSVSQRIRERFPNIVGLLPTDESRETSSRVLARLIYSRRRLMVFVVMTTMFGLLTFIVLGLRAPSRAVLILMWLAIFVGFALLGMVIAVGTGFWNWMYDFGRLQPRVNVFHPDRLGGLQPVGDLAGWVTNIGGILVLIYSAGAYYSPYARVELRQFSYSWVVGAALLLTASFFTPSYTIHRCLATAKAKVSDEVADEYQRLYAIVTSGGKVGEPATAELESRLAVLSQLEEAVDKLHLWPYTRLPARILIVIATQVLPVVLKRLLSPN